MSIDINYDDYDDYEDNDTRVSKKRKINVKDKQKYKEEEFYKFADILIYTIGNEVHYSTCVTKMSIEILIRQISDIIEKFYKDHDVSDELTITYIIDSGGGSVHSCLKFIDFLGLSKQKYSGLKFVSVISGFAASAASVMACVADERYMTKYSCAMIHELSSGTSGRYTQMDAYAKNLTNLHNMLVDIYLEHCNLTRKHLEKKMKSDQWYRSDEYLADGFVDKIK